jgi:[acyl-carrier-protein] S-malonyltransferase
MEPYNRDTVAFIYPGQGAQSLMAARQIATPGSKAYELLETFKEITNLDLNKIIQEDLTQEANRTEVAQPLLLALGLGLTQELLSHFPHPKPRYYAGLSLGEYTALGASGTVSAHQLFPLLYKRAKAMNQACLENPGTMAAVIGLSQIQVEIIVTSINQSLNETQLVIANYNTPQQMVLSGTSQAIQLAVAEAKKLNGKAIALKVQGAFHSPLMNSAKEAIMEEIQSLEIQDNQLQPVNMVMNYSGMITTGRAAIIAQLQQQAAAPTHWSTTVTSLYYAGVRHFVEIGGGNTLSKMVEKIQLPSGLDLPKTYTIQKLEDVQEFCSTTFSSS